MDKISSIRGMPDVFESDTNYLAELKEVLSKIFLSHNLNEVNNENYSWFGRTFH